MIQALGLHSPVLARVRGLRERAGRREAGRFLIEGPTLLADALAAGVRPFGIYGTGEALAAAGAILAGRIDPSLVFEVPERALARLSALETPPGLVAELPLVLAAPAELFGASPGAGPAEPVAILAGIADPGNAGTLLRSAEIFGLARIVVAEGGVDPYHPKVVRAAMGAHLRCRIAHASGAAIVAAAGAAGYTIVAAATGGESLPDFVFPERTAVAIGSERHGVAPALPHWDRTVSVPHLGAGESLNAAVAGSIVFYALAQSRSMCEKP